MRNLYWLVVALLLSVGCKPATMSGTWTLDKSESTDIDQWRSIVMTIDASADHFRFRRDFAAGRYRRADSVDIPTDGSAVEVTHAASAKWLDNVHLGVFIDEGTVETVSASWDDAGRKLRMTSVLPLQTSTGETVVRIESGFELSADGKSLTLSQNRSTRTETLTFVFDRKIRQVYT